MLIVQLDGEVRYSYRYPFSAIDPQEYRWASHFRGFFPLAPHFRGFFPHFFWFSRKL